MFGSLFTLGKRKKSRDKSSRSTKRFKSLSARHLMIENLENRELLSICTWTGGGTDNNWSSSANWQNNQAPVSGDALVFQGTTRINTNNDLTSTSFNSLTFNGTSNFTIDGNAIAISGSGPSITVNQAATIMIDPAINSASVLLTYVNNSSGTLVLNGDVNSSSLFLKNGGGALQLNGAAGCSSIQITAGTLETGSSNRFSNDPAISFYGGTLNLDGHDETICSLFSSGGPASVITGNGILTLQGGLTSSLTPVNISGNLNLTSGTHTFNIYCPYFTPSLTISANISGSGSINKTGTGQLILSGNNTYTGDTTITAGTLQIGSDTAIPHGSNYGNVTVNSGSILDLNGHNISINGLSGSGTIKDTATSAATLTVGYNNQTTTFSGAIQNGTGVVSLTKTGTGTLTLSGNNTYSGSTSIDDGCLQIGDGGTTGTLGNGSGAVVNNATLDFNRSNGYQVNNAIYNYGEVENLNTTSGSALTLTDLIDGEYESYIYNHGTLYLGENSYSNAWIENDSNTSGSLTIAGDTTYCHLYKHGSGQFTVVGNASYCWIMNDSSGLLQIGGNFTNGQHITTGSPDARITLDGSSNSYVGPVELNGGTLSFASWGSGYDNATIHVCENATATLRWLGTNNNNTEDISKYLRLDNGVTTTFDIGEGNIVHLANAFGDNKTGAIAKTGSGTLVLENNNTYSGGTTVSTGILQVGCYTDTGSLGNGNVVIAQDASLEFDYNADITIGNNISGNGSVTRNGSGTLFFTGNITYKGLTTIVSGTIQIGDGQTDGTLDIGSVTGSGSLVFNCSDDLVVKNDISGSLSIEKQGSGKLSLTGDNDYTGKTIIDAGTLAFANGSLGSTSDISITDNATLQCIPGCTQNISILTPIYITDGITVTLDDGGNNVTLSASIYVYTGSLIKAGAGTLTMSGNYAFSNVVINAGTLTMSGTDNFNSVTINKYGAMALSGLNTCDSVTINSDPPNSEPHNSGSLEVSGSLTLNNSTNPMTNYGTLTVVGSGIIYEGSTIIRGSGNSSSNSEAAISWLGFGGDVNTYTYELWDGSSWSTLATTTSADSTALLSGLQPNQQYTLKVTGNSSSGGNVSHESAVISTSSSSDTSGWYRIGDIECIDTNDTEEDAYLGVGEDVGDDVESNNSGGHISNCNLTGLKPFLNDAKLHVAGATDDNVDSFVEDKSWVYAGSLQGAILQSVQGLVTDGSLPTLDSDGSVTITRIYSPEFGLDCYTFNSDLYPEGGVSKIHRYKHKVHYDYFKPDPTRPTCGSGNSSSFSSFSNLNRGVSSGNDSSGGDSSSGSSDDSGDGSVATPGFGPSEDTGAGETSSNAIDNSGGCSCGRTLYGLTYDSRQCAVDTGYGPGWSDVDELPVLIVARNTNTLLARFGAEQAIWFDVQAVGGNTVYTARYGAKETLIHDTTNHLFILTSSDGTFYEFFDADQTDYPPGRLHHNDLDGEG
jgi:autotransporter-associated beta strand protein